MPNSTSSRVTILLVFLIVGCHTRAKNDLPESVLRYIVSEALNNAYPSFGEVFDANRQEFLPSLNSMDHGRINCEAVHLDDVILVTGGYNQEKDGQQKDAYLFSHLERMFKKTNDMIVPRTGHAMAKSSSDAALVFGGYTSDFTELPTKTIEKFDKHNETFSLKGNMIIERVGHKVLKITNDEFLIVGGFTLASYVSEIEIFNSVSSMSNQTGTLLRPRAAFTLHQIADGRIFVIGGFINDLSGNSEHIKLVEVLDQNGSHIHSFNLAIERSRHTSFVADDGKIVVVGGENANGYVSTIEVIDPIDYSIDSFLLEEPFRSSFAQSVKLGSDIVMFGGNTFGGASNKSVKITSGNLSQQELPSMLSPRTLHKAILLNSSQVFIVGGSNRILIR